MPSSRTFCLSFNDVGEHAVAEFILALDLELVCWPWREVVNGNAGAARRLDLDLRPRGRPKGSIPVNRIDLIQENSGSSYFPELNILQ